MNTSLIPRRALVTLCGVVFVTFLDTTIVSVALGDIQTRLHSGVTELQWVVNGYSLAFAALMLAAGALADRLGRRKVMIIGLSIFAAGSLLAALAPDIGALIAARVAMGIGAAACEPGTLSILRHVYPESTARTKALGWWAAACGLGLAAGPVLGGALVGIGSYRAVFYFSVGAGVLGIVASSRFVPESADPTPHRFDYAGFGLGTSAIAALAVGVILAEANGYASPYVIALFILGALGLIGLGLVERGRPMPMLDVSYFAQRAFSGALIVAFAVFFGIFAIFFFAALYLEVVVNYSGYRVALEFLPMAVGLIGTSIAAGRVVLAWGPRNSMAFGALIAAAGTLSSDIFLSQHTTPSLWLIATLAVTGVGFGLCVVPVTSVTLGVVPAERSGMAASATNTSRELGAVFGVAVLGALVNANLTQQLAQRLHVLGIPNAFQAIVINAIETGAVPSGNALAGDKAHYGVIVTKVVGAAYGAFRSGLETALVVSGVAMLIAGVVALACIDRDRGSALSPRG